MRDNMTLAANVMLPCSHVEVRLIQLGVLNKNWRMS